MGFYSQSLYSTLNIRDGQKQFVSNLLPLVLSGAVVQTGRYNVNQVLRVLQDNKGSTMTSISGMTLGIVSAALLGLETEAALYGVASGLLIGLLSDVFRNNVTFRSEKKMITLVMISKAYFKFSGMIIIKKKNPDLGPFLE